LKFLRLLVVFAVAAAALQSGPVGAGGESADELVVSQDHAWPPFSWRNERGEPEGLLIDLWREMGERLGRPVRFDLVDWPDTITQVAEGEAHVHGGLIRSIEREKLLEFSTELIPLSAFLFVENSLPVLTTDDLEAIEVGVVAASMELEHMRQHLPQISLREYDNNDRMVTAALAGEISAFVADYPVGMYLLDMYQAPSAFRPLTRLYQHSLRAAVRSGDDALLEEINVALAQLDEADLRRLTQRWMRSEPVEVVPPWLLPAMIAGALVLVLLVYAVFLLRQRRMLEREVAERTRQLGEQERLFRTLFENAGAAIFMLEGERFTAVNNALVELSGFTREELMAQELADLVHPEDRGLVIERARARQRGEDVPRQYQYRVMRADGEVRWVELTAGVAFLREGPVTVGTLYDLTGHRRLEQQLRASETRYRMLVENASDIVFLLSVDGQFEYVSPNVNAMLGYAVEDVVGRSLVEFVHPDDVVGIRRLIGRACRSGDRVHDNEFRLRHRDGRYRWYSSNIAPMYGDGDQVRGISGIARDISEYRAAEAERRRQHEFRRLIAEISTDILNAPINRIGEVMEGMLERLGRFFEVDRAYIYRIGDDGKRVYLVHEWCAGHIEPTDKSEAILRKCDYPWWFGQVLEYMRGNAPFYIRAVAQLPQEAASERKLFEAQDVSSLVTMPLRSGDDMIGFFGFDSCRPRDWERELDALLVVLANLLSDVFEKMRLEQELMRSSITDPLTGLYNRRYLLAQLDRAIESYRHDGTPFALAMFDIDHFKQLNDSLGHLAGDAVLEELARLVIESSRDEDVVGRFGGEEFMILLQGIEPENAKAVMGRVLSAVGEHLFLPGEGGCRITASGGLVAACEFEGEALSADGLIGRADRRLYLAKQGGRDRLVCWGQDS
jgi:diguanylate cyclase (GGDEF)-like protein/PAS domain S-box-containing protein